jgi:hypothetical protein
MKNNTKKNTKNAERMNPKQAAALCAAAVASGAMGLSSLGSIATLGFLLIGPGLRNHNETLVRG